MNNFIKKIIDNTAITIYNIIVVVSGIGRPAAFS